MAAGLFALLDDVAVLTRAAAASLDDIGVAAGRASLKAAGVVVDDAAVTPQYVQGLTADRELPIVRRIAFGSLRNKLLFILPAVLLMSQFAPALLTPILMLGGAYLCYEGAEKIWHRVHASKQQGDAHSTAAVEKELIDEKSVVAGAVRTDFILSAEIMVIALNEVADQPLLSRAAILLVVAIGITVLVYGTVGLIVKMDDIGLSLAQRPAQAVAKLGRGMVLAMPKLLTGLAVLGTAAMLWVGGHILLVGLKDLGASGPYNALTEVEDAAGEAVGALGGVVAWLIDTSVSALIGLVVGAVVVAVVTFVKSRRNSGAPAAH